MDSIKCIKFKHQLFDNLNIVYNVSSRTIVFWNKYQIFLFDELKYENLANICQWSYFSEFKIAQVILSNNYLMCLDDSGNIYVSPLKFKQSAQKRIKSGFQLRENGILCIDYNEDVAYSIQKEAKKLYFCVHKINSEFQLQNKIEISNIQCPNNIICGKFVFCTHILTEMQFMFIKDIFELKNVQWSNQIVVVLSFDNLTLHAFLISLKPPQQNSPVIKLLTCPSQISNVCFDNDNNLCIIVSLASGTLLKLPLNSEYKTPNIVHLNIAIIKLLAIKDTMIYTDGVTMWKSENTFSETNLSFRQFTIRQVKDFIKVADQIVCVTYSKLIYLISLEEESCYLELPTTNEYCSSEHLLNNADYLYKIMEEIEKNDQIIKKIKKEENYITTLALSNRKDIMDDVIHYNIIVFENYEDILKEDIPLMITNNIEEYFDTELFYFLIKITTTCHLQQKFSDILSNLFGNLKIHITLLSAKNILQTNSIKVQEQLKNINIVIPLNAQMLNLTDITVNIKLVTLIPSALNEKEMLWANLHYKKIVLNSEHFIKSEYSKNNIQFLKEPKKSIKELIYETASNHHGQLFKINRVLNTNDKMKWPFYVKLPSNYQESLSNKAYYVDNFNPSKANYLLKEITSEEFLRSRRNLCFIIANDKVEVELLNDGFSDPLLRVISQNPQVALGIRNFFSNLAHNMFRSYEKEFVSNALYDSIENIEKIIEVCMLNQFSIEEFFNLFDQYQKSVIGAIVL